MKMSASATQEFQDGQTQSDKMLTKIKNNPMVPLGIVGMFSMVGYGFYNYKNRGAMSTSVYLMQLRVQAQSMVVGAMTLGISYNLIKDYLKKKEKKS